jgi:hypothetical protein
MKTLEQNWLWMFMVGLPLLISTINLSRNVWMSAVSIPSNGFSVKQQRCSGASDNSISTGAVMARAEKNP